MSACITNMLDMFLLFVCYKKELFFRVTFGRNNLLQHSLDYLLETKVKTVIKTFVSLYKCKWFVLHSAFIFEEVKDKSMIKILLFLNTLLYSNSQSHLIIRWTCCHVLMSSCLRTVVCLTAKAQVCSQSVGFIVDRVAQRSVFSKYFSFPLIVWAHPL